MRTILLSLVATFGLVGSARSECRQEDSSAPVTTRVEKINGKTTLVIEKEIVICGRPARPAVAYVTSAKDVDYSWMQLTEGFFGAWAPNPISKIVKSVKLLGGRP